MNEEELYRQELEDYGFEESDLTPEESRQLRQEVRARLNGEIVLDGVLSRKLPNLDIDEDYDE